MTDDSRAEGGGRGRESVYVVYVQLGASSLGVLGASYTLGAYPKRLNKVTTLP